MERKPPAIRNIGIDLDRPAMMDIDRDGPVELRHGCSLCSFKAFPLRGRELVYCDPPCLQATRRSVRRYRHDFKGAAHAALQTLLKLLECQVMISGYPSRLYETQLASRRSMQHGRPKSPFLHIHMEPTIKVPGQVGSRPSG